jgi:hypothetical protein
MSEVLLQPGYESRHPRSQVADTCFRVASCGWYLAVRCMDARATCLYRYLESRGKFGYIRERIEIESDPKLHSFLMHRMYIDLHLFCASLRNRSRDICLQECQMESDLASLRIYKSLKLVVHNYTDVAANRCSLLEVVYGVVMQLYPDGTENTDADCTKHLIYPASYCVVRNLTSRLGVSISNS